MTRTSSRKHSLISLPKKLSFEDGLPIIMVTWLDASYREDDSELTKIEDFGKTVVCIDVGICVRENKREIVLASGGCATDDTVRYAHAIPKQMILEVVHLGEAKWTQPNTHLETLFPT